MKIPGFRLIVTAVWSSLLLISILSAGPAFSQDTCGEATEGGTCYYIDPVNGSDGNDGKSVAGAWETFANITSFYYEDSRPDGWVGLKSYDYVYLLDGTYDYLIAPGVWGDPDGGTLRIAYFSTYPGSSPVNNVSILNYPGHRPVLDARNAGNGFYFGDLGDGWTLRGIEIKNASASCMIIRATENIVVENMYIHDCYGPGSNNSSGLVAGEGCFNATIRNNLIENVIATSDPDHNAACIMIFEGNNFHIHNNEIRNCGAGIRYKHHARSQSGEPLHTEIFRNIVSDTPYAIVTGTDNALVYENIITDSAIGAMVGLADPINDCDEAFDCEHFSDNAYYNNTMYNVGVGLNQGDTDREARDTVFRDNVVNGEMMVRIFDFCPMAMSDYNCYSRDAFDDEPYNGDDLLDISYMTDQGFDLESVIEADLFADTETLVLKEGGACRAAPSSTGGLRGAYTSDSPDYIIGLADPDYDWDSPDDPAEQDFSFSVSGGCGAVDGGYETALLFLPFILLALRRAKHKCVLIALLSAAMLFFSAPAFSLGDTYYVGKTDCSDTDPDAGTSESMPFCTIDRANDAHAGGDTVLIMPGEYKEFIFPKTGLSESEHTVYRGLGKLGEVKIVGSDELDKDGWTQHSGSIYRQSFSAPSRCGDNGFQTSCWEDRTRWYYPVSSLDGLNGAGKYYYDGSTLYLWAHSGTPSDHTVECSARDFANWSRWRPYADIPAPTAHLTLENLTFMHSHGHGLTIFEASNDVEITGNEFAFNTGCGSTDENPSAVYKGTSDPMSLGIVITGNLIHDQGSDLGPGTEATGSDHRGEGIKLYAVDNPVISNNTLYNNYMGIYVKSGEEPLRYYNVTIRNNVIYDSGDSGIVLGWGGEENDNAGTIEGNVIYNMGGYGIYTKENNSNLKIFNNTIFNVSIGVVLGTWSEEYLDVGHDFYMYDNIISGVSGFFLLRWGSHETVHSNNNLFYGNTDHFFTIETYDGTVNTTDYPDISDWINTTDYGSSFESLQADPLFTDPEEFVFSLQENSPGRDMGKFIEGFHCPEPYEKDPDRQDCRHWTGSAPDAGAIEYGLEFLYDRQDGFNTVVTGGCGAVIPAETGSSVVWVSILLLSAALFLVKRRITLKRGH